MCSFVEKIRKKAGDFLKGSKIIEIVWLSDEDFKEIWKEFKKTSPQKISLVDVASKVICKKLGISEIFAFDQDFKKLGLNTVP